MGRVADLATGYPGYWGMIPKENGFLPEILRAHGYANYAIGKWHLTPDDEVNMAGSRRELAARPRLRPLVRISRRRDAPVQPVAVPRQPRGARAGLVRNRLPPERRPRRSRDRIPLRPARRRRRAAVLLLLRDRCVPLPSPRAGGVDRALPRTVRRGLGRLARSDVRTPARERAAPARHATVAAPPLGARVGRARPEDQAVAARFMECFAAYLSYTDAQIGRVLEYLAESGDLDKTLIVLCSDNGASSEGGRAARSTTPACTTARRPVAASSGSASTSSAARPRTTTIRGAGRWPATRRSSGGSARCTRAASPIPASSAPLPRRRHGGDVRHQFAHAIDFVPTVLELIGLAAPETIDGIAQSRVDGTSFLYSSRDADAPDNTKRSTSRCSARAPSTTAVEGRDVPRARAHVRRRARPERALGRRRVGALRQDDRLLGARDLAEQRARAPRGDGRALVGGGTAQRRAAARQPPPRSDHAPPATARGSPRSLRVQAVRRARARALGRARAEPRAHDHGRGRDRRR